MNTGELKQLLGKRYAPPAYGLLWEVGEGTGANCRRHCDALAMSLWPSRGIELLGFELKASRGDWLKERDNPAKSDPILRYCDRWYLVAADSSIVKLGELPLNWGLMVPKGKSLVVVTEAPRLEPQALSKKFLAGVFRQSALQSADAAASKAAYEAGYADGKSYGLEQSSYENKRGFDELARFRKVCADFSAASGVHLDQYTWEVSEIGKAVKIVLAGEHRRDFDELARIEAAADKAKEAIVHLRELYREQG